MADPRGKAVFGPFYAQIEAQSRKIFGGGDERYGNESAIGMDIMDMMNDMPLVSVLMFQQGALTMPAEEMVDGLLMQVHSMDTVELVSKINQPRHCEPAVARSCISNGQDVFLR